MNWPLFIEVAIGLLGMALGGVWWLSSLNQRFINHVENDKEAHKELNHQVERLRDWRHRSVSPILQAYVMEYERKNDEKLVSYTDLEDSRMTRDPSKEPLK